MTALSRLLKFVDLAIWQRIGEEKGREIERGDLTYIWGSKPRMTKRGISPGRRWGRDFAGPEQNLSHKSDAS